MVAAVGVGTIALFNWLGWYGPKTAPLWFGALFGISGVFGPKLLEHCERRGWIRGVFFDPKKRAELTERKQKLAEKWQQLEAERQTILRNARK
ncbi:MAG: hypothetical protein GC200_08695 [Tepidisphaera sp.]|nr:hypothetical protein [Tepidisphaera sp.]